MNWELQVHQKQSRLCNIICNYENYDRYTVNIPRSTTEQLESFPRQEITVKSDIFLQYVYPAKFQLTRRTNFRQYFKS
jgi:hypothetical protein